MLELEKKVKEILYAQPELVGKRFNLLVVSGSRAYGTSRDESDLDIRGIYENGYNDILGLAESTFSYNKEGNDIFLLSLIKAIKSLMRQRSSELELLYSDENNYIALDYVGKELIKNRKLFMSKHIYYTFGGYAKAIEHSIKESDDREKNCKSATHLLRLLYMGTEALKEGEIRAYREKELDILNWVRWEDAIDSRGEISELLSKTIDNAKLEFDRAFMDSKLRDKISIGRIALLYNKLNNYNVENCILFTK